MTATPLIAGNGMARGAWLESEPAHGPTHGFSVGTPAMADQAAKSPGPPFGHMSLPPGRHGPHSCAPLQKKSARDDAIMATGSAETGLPLARLQGQRGRTTANFRLFADHVQAGSHLDRRHDHALPDRAPCPAPTCA